MHPSGRTSNKYVQRQLIFQDRSLLILLLIIVVTLILQITLGGVVRVTGSGEGCPDWPQCFGRWYPPFEYHAILEYSHRSLGSLAGICVIVATVIAWLKYREVRSLTWVLSGCLVLIAIVGGLGGAVVISELNPAIRSVHLLLAEIVVLLAVFALVAATYTRRGASGTSSTWIWGRVSDEHRGILNLVAITSMLTLVSLLSGSYAVWREAGAVCNTWPLCGGRIIPESELAWIHMTHRLLSLVTTGAVLLAGHRAWRLPNTSGALRAAALTSAFLIFAQLLTGAANPWTNFDEWARVGHLSMATLVWANMVFIIALILRPVRRGMPLEDS